MKKQIAALSDAVDQTATDYVTWRSENSERLSDKDAEAFGHLISAKKNLEWALQIAEEQDASTD